MSHPSPTIRLSLRIDERNPNHHLWDNNGTWWAHATLHIGPYRKRRVRISLRTKYLGVARRKRDTWLQHLLGLQKEVA